MALLTSIDNSGLNLASGNTLKVDGTTVLDASTLGNSVVNSNLTKVGILSTGSISSGFGDIDVGTSTINTGGLLKVIGNADADDKTADSLTGRLTVGASENINWTKSRSNWTCI